ncbi:exodeoxyribonuclease VII small subunit [Desulfovibrionales bacterium]
MAKKLVDFENGLARLQEIVIALEGPSLPLERGVALYKEGLLMVEACRERLEKAQLEISVFKGEVSEAVAVGSLLSTVAVTTTMPDVTASSDLDVEK